MHGAINKISFYLASVLFAYFTITYFNTDRLVQKGELRQ